MTPEVQFGRAMVNSYHLDKADILMKEETEIVSRSPSDIFNKKFRLCINDAEFMELIKNKEKIGIVINDRNRPTPTYLMFSHLLSFDNMVEKISKVHIATGTHKEPTENDLQALMGDSFHLLKDRVHIHVAKDESGHISYGKTSRGTPLAFDKELEGHDLYILVNSVEPHYFAGYTGGRKSIIPGMAYFGTIEKNHSHALSNGSKTLGLEGNPVHEDMEEGAGIFLTGKEHLSIQIIQGPGKIITDVKVGDIFTSFREAIQNALREFCIPIEGKYDIVISVARSPMDRTLYQAQKAIENGKLALKDGGVLLLVAECNEGIGQSTFWDLLTMSNDPDKILKTIDDGYLLGYHKAAKIVQLAKRANIFALSNLAAEELEKGFIRGFSDLDTALNEAIKITGTDPRILLIPDGTVTVPHVKEELQ